jgi:glycerol-3-phosphate dehydrogenase
MIARIDNRHEPWDIVIIGGGATGVGIAVDAASRGYDVLLLEQHDFGKGTSSRSTKLVHGGVRYLEQGNIALVMEALKERGLLRQNAPHLVSNLAFVVPNYDWWEAPFYGLGLKIYNALAGKYGFGSSEILTREETLARLPTIRTDGLRGGVVYYDGQFDDTRLLINLVETAADQGATLVNYARVIELTKAPDGFIDGVVAADQESGQQWTIAARVVINATGAFSDSVRRLAEPDVSALIAPSQGIHLVFHRSFLPSDAAIMVPHTSDGRVMFAIPWHDHTLVGTTDTPIATPTLEPRPLPEEIEFILETAGQYLLKGTDSRRCPERVRRHSSARQEWRRQVDCRVVSRSHDSLRCVGPADDDWGQVDDVSQHGRARGRPGCRLRAVDRATVCHAYAQHSRLSLQRRSIWRTQHVRI